MKQLKFAAIDLQATAAVALLFAVVIALNILGVF